MTESTRIRFWIVHAVVAGLICTITGGAFPVLASRALTQQEAETQVNIELILDSSGSMAEVTNTGETRSDAAKRALNEVIDAIPEDRPELNVGFRVFGHRGNNTEAGKTESCQSSDLTVPIERVNKEALREQVARHAPVGWTPIGLSLDRAASDFPPAMANVVNAIILVADGLETCGLDPCALATALKQSDAAVTANVVGFGLDEAELGILGCIAENTGGQTIGAQNADELAAALSRFFEELQAVSTTSSGLREGDTVVVTAPDIVLRAAPSETGVVVQELPEGTRLTVLGPSEKRNGKVWWKVENTADGATGWLKETAFILLTPTDADPTPMVDLTFDFQTPHPAFIHEGACDALGDVIYTLADLTVPLDGEKPIGVQSSAPVAFSSTVVDARLTELVGSPRSLVVHESAETSESYLACGDLGGYADDLGSDVYFALRPYDESAFAGLAWLHRANDGRTQISAWLFRVN